MGSLKWDACLDACWRKGVCARVTKKEKREYEIGKGDGLVGV